MGTARGSRACPFIPRARRVLRPQPLKDGDTATPRSLTTPFGGRRPPHDMHSPLDSRNTGCGVGAREGAGKLLVTDDGRGEEIANCVGRLALFGEVGRIVASGGPVATQRGGARVRALIAHCDMRG